MKANFYLILTVLMLSFGSALAQVARWRLEGNANATTGTNGTATNTTAASWVTDSREGNQALTFNNNNQYVIITSPSLPTGSNARTICAWAKFTYSPVTGAHNIFTYGANTAGQWFTIGMNGTTLFGGAGAGNDLSVSSFWAQNVWHHIALTYDGTTARLYADGVEVANGARSWSTVAGNAFISRASGNSGYWGGPIDDVRVYNTALSASAILALATVPPAPTSVAATASSSTAVDITWSESATTETGFQVERSLSSGGTYTLVGTAAANATSYQDTGLTPQTQYFYRVRTVADNANSAYTSIVNTTPLAAPTGFSTTVISATQIDLAWTDSSIGETGFDVERSTTSGGGFSVVTTSAANATSFSNTGLSPATTYYYRIRAKNSGGTSSYTSESSKTTLAAAPNVPTSPSATGLSPSSIKIDWTDASSNETGFEIDRSTSSGSGFALITTTAANISTYTDTGLSAGTTYYYRIRAINGSYQSAYTSVVSSATFTITPPAVPNSLTATASTPTSIVLGWTDLSNNETGFEIQRSTTTGAGFTTISTTSPNATSFIDEPLTANTTYYYRIRSTNSAGPSSYTLEASATTPLAPPAAATGLNAVPATSSINLNWTDNATNENEYIIERSISSGISFAVIATVAANTTSFSDNNANPGQPYYYRIKAINSGGNSSYSDEVTATISIPGVTQLCKGLFCDSFGSVGIGTQIIPSGYKLSIKGKLMAEGVKVDLQSAWPDYVFDDKYKLRDLPSLRSYINQNGHLPNIPSAAEVDEKGIDLEEINVKLLEKIEELSLYMIQMEQRIKTLETENKSLKSGGDKK